MDGVLEKELDKSELIDSKVLLDYTESIDEVFKMYIEDISPFIVNFEINQCEFPVEVQNEIRSIYGHLVRAAMSESPNEIQRNIEKMKAHSKRALLDCFKYTSIVYSDYYNSFMKRYQGVDLTYIENGNFLREVVKKYENAKTLLKKAKMAEMTNITTDDLFDLYNEAYFEFESLHKRIEGAEEDATYLKHKATKKDVLSVISILIGILGIIIGFFV